MRHQVRLMFLCAVISLIAASSATARTRRANGHEPNPSVYTNSESGLRHLIQDSIAAAKANDQAKLAELTNSMVLPSPEEWFLKVFGAEWGSVYAKLYKENQGRASANLANIFSEATAQKFSILQVREFKNSCDFSADKDEYPMLAARVVPEPFSVVRFAKGQDVRTLRFLAYVDGGFRFLGLLRVPADLYPGIAKSMGLKPGASTPPDPLVVAENVQRAKKIQDVAPIYPLEGRMNHVEGTVVLHSIIETDGTVGDVRVMMGQCPFAIATVRAIKQWKFSPTLADGVAVRTSTIWEVNFNLSGR